MSDDVVVRGTGVTGQHRQAEAQGGFAAVHGQDFADYTESGAVSLGAQTRGAAAVEVLFDGDPQDVVEIVGLDESVRFQRAGGLVAERRPGTRHITGFATDETFGAELGQARRVRAVLPAPVAAAVAELDQRLTWVDNHPLGRSAAAVGIDVLAPVLIDDTARQAARTLAEWVESPATAADPEPVRRRRPKEPGVYRIGPELLVEPDRRLVRGGGLAGDEPWLLLVHGTLSHTEATFAALRNTAEWSVLTRRYGDRMLALEHPTLALSPAQNALAAVTDLPAGARLHVVSHSRGGLIGDLLSLARDRMPDLSAHPDRHPDRAVLDTLHQELRDRKIAITRFVRVAAPARGTTLASRRLDAWASILFNLATVVPALRDSGVPELIRKFLLAVLDRRTDPRMLPGIEALMPESACVRMLNMAPPPAATDGLANLIGDIDSGGITRRVMAGLADPFHGAANDLVVDTHSMTGGLPRRDERVARFRGADVNHAGYFANVLSRRALRRWLVGDTVEVRDFETVTPDPADDRCLPAGPATASPRACILLVPDALGCVISTTEGELWPDVRALARCGPATVLDPRGPGRVTALLPAYAGVRAGLSGVGEVRPVLWDARRSWSEAIEAFRSALNTALDRREPVHVIAHGAGALLVEAARDRDAGRDWARLRERGGQCLLLSPPLDGSSTAAARTEGRDALTAMLPLIHPETDRRQLGRVLATLPGLIAQQHRGKRVERDPAWWDGVTAIYGAPARTATVRDANGELVATDAGDGNVAYRDTEHPGLRRQFATASTWDLLQDRDAGLGLGELLAGRESTCFLSSAIPAGEEAEAWDGWAGRLPFPTADDLGRVALHGPGVPHRAPPQLHVSVWHGDLRRVRRPLLLGSFDGTPIAGAEGVLDTMLEGALTRRQALGQHPGPVETMAVFADKQGKPAAVVIGIGDPGDITPSRLTTGVTQAVLRLAAGRLEASAEHHERFDLAAVLIGTSGTAPLSVQASVTAIVNGVRRANRRLRGLPRPTAVASLQIVELYEERAADAARALALLLDNPDAAAAADPTGERLIGETRVITGWDGQVGQPRREDRQDEWSTVRVGRADSGEAAAGGLAALSFTRLGRGAGADQHITTAQRRLVDRMVTRSIGTSRVDRQLYNTLYELLLPPSMKGRGRERDNIMYVVDEHAATLPFELLGTRSYDGTPRPMAVDVGVIRRLETRRYRFTQRVAAGTSALVIGNPPSRYEELPGAAEEAHLVAEQLRGYGYQVTELVAWGRADRDRVNAETIMNALFGREHRILHIAAHGVYDAATPAASGVVIDDDLYLTALEIQQMQAVPELVFLNCCHAGAIRPLSVVRPEEGGDPRIAEGDQPWRPDLTAASISRALIDGGVRAVIAAGWAVDDRAAAAFAGQLYQHLLDGTDLGRATLWARQHVHGGEFRDTNTWGAYQVYGPPAFTLKATRGAASDEDRPVSRREFRDRLAVVHDAARRSVDTAAIIRRLRTLLDNAGPDWLAGEEHGLIGAIRGELGQYREAIDAFEAALSRWDADVQLKVVEQLANLESKAAVQGILEPKSALPAPRTPDQLFGRAYHRIRNLIEIAGPTPERLSLFGSYWRRQAQADAARGVDAGAAAAESARAYREADELSVTLTGETNAYAAINYALMEWIAGQYETSRGRTDRAGTRDELQAVVRDAAESARNSRRTEFWIRVIPADAALAAGLLGHGLSETEVAAEYEKAFSGGASARERLSIIEHVGLLRDLVRDDEAHVAVRAGLANLARQLAVRTPWEVG